MRIFRSNYMNEYCFHLDDIYVLFSIRITKNKVTKAMVLGRIVDWFFISRNPKNFTTGEGKGKIHPRTDHEDPEGEQKYSCTLSLTSVLDDGGWSMLRPGRFILKEENRCSWYRRLCGPQGRAEQLPKMSSSPEFHLRNFQPVASHYTDYANPAQVQNRSICIEFRIKKLLERILRKRKSVVADVKYFIGNLRVV